MNKGRCVNREYGWTCVCSHPFVGKNCQSASTPNIPAYDGNNPPMDSTSMNLNRMNGGNLLYLLLAKVLGGSSNWHFSQFSGNGFYPPDFTKYHSPTSPSFCKPISCNLQCEYGLARDRQNCPYCKCLNICENRICPPGYMCKAVPVPCKNQICLPFPVCVEILPCWSNPCLNNGKCVNYAGKAGWKCFCPKGTYGERCES